MGYRLNNAQQFLGVHSSATSLTLLYPPADYLGATALVGSSSPYTQYYSDGNQWIGVYDENTISTTRLRNHFRKVWERNRQKAGYGVLYVPNTANVVYIDPTASTDGAGTVASPRNILPATVANNTTYLFKERTTLNLTDTRWGTGVGAGTIFGTYESYTGNRILTDLSRLATINFTSASTNTQIFNLTATNTNVTFSGVRFTCPDVIPGRRDAIYAGTASTSINTVIEYCYFEGIDSRPASGIPLGSCIFSFSDNIVVRFNTARNNICDIMWMGENASKVGGKNPHIYGNDFIVPVVDRDGPDALQISYDMTGTGHPMQLKITDNWLEINSNQKQCLVSNGSNVADGRGYVARNVFWGHDMSGPVLGTNNSKTVEWQLSNTIFESNVFRGGHYGINLSWPADVRGNIFIADHTTFGDATLTTSTKYYGVVLPASTTNQVRVTNNTFIRIGNEAIGMAIQQYTDSTQHIIANNIILGKFFRGISMKVSGQIETHNCVIGPTTPYANHSTGAALTGTNAVLVDPLLDSTLTPTNSALKGWANTSYLLPFTDIYNSPFSSEVKIIGAVQDISAEGAALYSDNSNATLPVLAHHLPVPADVDLMGLKSEYQWSPLNIPSPYSPGHVLHPSVLYFPGGWKGYRYWMGYTPYPDAVSDYENPCVCASNDGLTWIAMGPQPLVSWPGVGGYNSDTDLAYDHVQDRLLLVFRRKLPADVQKLYIMSTTDGTSWSPFSVIYTSANEGTATSTDIMSPSLVFNGTNWEIWGVLDCGSSNPNPIAKISNSNTDPFTGWSQTPATITMTAPSGRDWWHSQIRRLSGGAYVAMIQDNAGTSGSIGDLYIAYSSNGTDWTSRLFDSGSGRGYSWYRPSFVVLNDRSDIVVDVYGSRLNDSSIYHQRCVIQRPSTYPARAFEVSAAITAATLGGVNGILAADSFNRTNSSTSLGSTLSGQTWTQDTASIIGISNNRAYNVTTGNSRVHIDVGRSNYQVSCVFTESAGSGTWIVLRYADGNNYCRLGKNTPADQLRWQVISGGSITVNQQLGVTPVNGDEITVSCIGAEFVVYVNGARVTKLFHHSFVTNTRVGIQLSGTVGYIDNFIVQGIY